MRPGKYRAGGWRRHGDPAAPGYLIPFYPAWLVSMRKRRSAYTGFCMRVQNATTNVLTDIAFKTDGWVDEVALAACRTGTQILRVAIWYDQGTSSVNLVQATQTKQPRIIGSTGVVDTYSGHPAPSFVETLRYLEVATPNAVFNTTAAAGLSWESFAGIGTLDAAHFNTQIDTRTATGPGFAFMGVDNTRKILFYNGSVFDGAGPTTVADNSEHGYAWCVGPTVGGSGNLHQFIDGVLQKTDLGIGIGSNATRPLRVGESLDLNGSEWPGVVAEVDFAVSALHTASYTPRTYL